MPCTKLGTQRILFTFGGLLVLAASSPAFAQRTAGPAHIEEHSDAVAWTGKWSKNALAANSGGSARLAMDAGSEVRLDFSGTAVKWIGYRDEWSGLADVLIDDVFQATIDTYSKPARAQAVLFSIQGLPEGRHTLVIRPKGTHQEASGGSWVWVDAFVVGIPNGTEGRSRASGRSGSFIAGEGPTPRSWLNPGQSNRIKRGARLSRVAESDPSAQWTGAWSTNTLPAHSGRSARLSMDSSARVDFAFTGTGVTWIGYGDEWSGVADVLVDGELQATVDTYSPNPRAQVQLYGIGGLAEGSHTLTIKPTGRRQKESGGAWVWVDGFSVAR